MPWHKVLTCLDETLKRDIMKAILLALSILAISSNIQAQDSTRHAKKMDIKKSMSNTNTTKDGNNLTNGATTPMNSNGNNTPTSNTTRNMNDKPIRNNAIDTATRNK
jgi:hypothetical protein